MSKERKPFPSETQERFIVRFPEGMRDRIKAEADKNNRSMNSEIVARLGQSLRLPAMVDSLMEAYETVDAAHEQKDALLEKMVKLYEAQKIVSDQQQHIIDQLLKALPLIPDEDTQKVVSKKAT